MKYFSKIKIAWLFILLLSAVNITLLMFQLFFNQTTEATHSENPHHTNRNKRECMLKSELHLSTSQSATYDSIKENQHQTAMPIVDSLRHTRSVLMAELKKEKFDSLYAFALVDKINHFNSTLFSLSIVQYIQIDNILDSAQKSSLSKIYCDMFGCKKHNGCSAASKPYKGCASGKGCE